MVFYENLSKHVDLGFKKKVFVCVCVCVFCFCLWFRFGVSVREKSPKGLSVSRVFERVCSGLWVEGQCVFLVKGWPGLGFGSWVMRVKRPGFERMIGRGLVSGDPKIVGGSREGDQPGVFFCDENCRPWFWGFLGFCKVVKAIVSKARSKAVWG